MKVSICNPSRIEKAIKIFEIFHLKKPYIFMNLQTIDFLRDMIPMDFYYEKKSEKENCVVSFKDCLLYNNENLKFGEIEIR